MGSHNNFDVEAETERWERDKQNRALPTPHLFRKDAPRCQWAVYLEPPAVNVPTTTETPQCEREAGHPGRHLFRFSDDETWRVGEWKGQ